MKLFNFLKKKKECKTDEYCPIYLSYLNKYGPDSKEIKYCKNSNKQYCTKYRIIDDTEWKKLSKVEKMKIIRDMNLIEFVEKKRD